MKIITENPATLPGTPSEIRITDWTFWVRPIGETIGELWFETEFGPSSLFIRAWTHAGARFFSLSHDRVDESPVEFEVDVWVAMKRYFDGLKASAAGVVAPTCGGGRYVCPYCGEAKDPLLPYPDGGYMSTCSGLLGPLQFVALPPIFTGDPVDKERYDAGTALLRFSQTILKGKHDHGEQSI